MKKLLLTILITIALLVSTNTIYGGGESNSATAVNKGITTTIDNSAIIPAPITPIPGFVAPSNDTNGIWTSSPFDLKGTYFTVPQLCRIANPSRALGFLWPEWSKSFKIEVACWDKAKPQKRIRVYPSGYGVTYRTRMGEIHARAMKLHKSEIQVAAAVCVYALKQGATMVIIHSFSNPVTKANTAVLGGAGVGVRGNGDVINSAGGFGWATAEKVYRSYVVAELYR